MGPTYNEITDEGTTALVLALHPGSAFKTLGTRLPYCMLVTRACKDVLQKVACEAVVEVWIDSDEDSIDPSPDSVTSGERHLPVAIHLDTHWMGSGL